MYHFCGHNWSLFLWSVDTLVWLDSLSKPFLLPVPPPFAAWPTLQPRRSSESRQAGRARYAGQLLKIGRRLTLERLGLLRTCNFVYELTCLTNFMMFIFQGWRGGRGGEFDFRITSWSASDEKLWTSVGHLSGRELMHRGLGGTCSQSSHTHPS